jgi:hypothetical protein
VIPVKSGLRNRMSETPSKDPSPAGTEADAASTPPATDNGRRWVKLGVGAAIGSAAIAAALLYANRPSRNDRS